MIPFLVTAALLSTAPEAPAKVFEPYCKTQLERYANYRARWVDVGEKFRTALRPAR